VRDVSDLIKTPVQLNEDEKKWVLFTVNSLTELRGDDENANTIIELCPTTRDLLILLLSAGAVAVEKGIVFPRDTE